MTIEKRGKIFYGWSDTHTYQIEVDAGGNVSRVRVRKDGSWIAEYDADIYRDRVELERSTMDPKVRSDIHEFLTEIRLQLYPARPTVCEVLDL